MSGGEDVARRRTECDIIRAGNNRMKILNAIINLFKGDGHAGRTEGPVSGRDGRERRILHSIPSICKWAVSDIGGVGVLARTCADERGGDTGTLPPDPVRKESITLKTLC